MRNCPNCNQPLTPVDYEGSRVLQCEQCHGFLVGKDQLASIKRTAGKTQAELKAEATADFRGSSAGRRPCPRCHAVMSKQIIGPSNQPLEIDVCVPCALIWLDGGELALIQLAHEATPGFAAEQELKRRMAALEASPKRNAAFEQNLAKLRIKPGPIEEGIAEAFKERVRRTP